MTDSRALREAHRLNLERIRDALFETRIILQELERDNSITLTARRALEADIAALEMQLEEGALERAVNLRSRARAFYEPPLTRVSTAL